MRSPENFEVERNIQHAFEAQKIDRFFEYAKAREAEGGRIQESQFADVYGAADIEADTRYVRGRIQESAEESKRMPENARRAQSEMRKLAYVMEVMLADQGELSCWFGRDAEVVLASEYDDWKNGVDAVVKFNKEEGAEHLALAVDFTLARGSQSKLRAIKENIDAGQMAEVKYFDPENEESDPQKLAKVVVSCDTATLTDAATLWKKGKKSKEDLNALARHPIQMIVLREIQAQLAAFRDYADTKGKKEFARLYTKNLAMIDAIIGEKEEEKIEADPEQDGAFQSLIRMLRVELPRAKAA